MLVLYYSNNYTKRTTMTAPNTDVYLRFRSHARRDNASYVESKMRSSNWDPEQFNARSTFHPGVDVHGIVRGYLGRQVEVKVDTGKSAMTKFTEICDQVITTQSAIKDLIDNGDGISASSPQLAAYLAALHDLLQMITTVCTVMQGNDTPSSRDLLTTACTSLTLHLNFLRYSLAATSNTKDVRKLRVKMVREIAQLTTIVRPVKPGMKKGKLSKYSVPEVSPFENVDSDSD